MKIGPYELESSDASEANRHISEFLNITSEISLGDKAYSNGRSFLEDKQYRLIIDNLRHVGIKLQYDKQFSHKVEFIVRDVRNLIGMKGYTIKTMQGFPMNGKKWREGNCLLSDWGPKDRRIDLHTLNASTINTRDKTKFLEELGKNFALSYALGLWDRRESNFVWDVQDKIIISIDHESLSDEEIEQDIPRGFFVILNNFFNPNWHLDQEMKLTFQGGFGEIWSKILSNRNLIAEIIHNYGFVFKKNAFTKRISKPSTIPWALLTMP